MKPIQLVVYGAMFVASLTWGIVLRQFFELPKFGAVLSGLVLGPITVILILYLMVGRYNDEN